MFGILTRPGCIVYLLLVILIVHLMAEPERYNMLEHISYNISYTTFKELLYGRDCTMYVSVGFRLEPYLTFIIVQFKCTYIPAPLVSIY